MSGKAGWATAFVFALGLSAQAQMVVNHAGGFAGQTDMSLNGGAVETGGRLRLTDAVGQIRSAFTNTQFDVSRFDTTFEFQVQSLAGAQVADGLCFVIQRGANTTVGTGGGNELGYQGIPNSTAIKFDIYMSNTDPSQSCTNIMTGGTGFNGGTNLLAPAPAIDLRDPNIKRARLLYDGTTLTVTITDLTTAAVKTQTYTTNILTSIGTGTVANIGFTAATGGLGATMEIINWVYTILPPPPAAPTNVNAVGGLLQITVTWQAVAGVTEYHIYRRPQQTPAAAFAQIATVPVGTLQYVDTGITPNVVYEYVVRAFTAGGAGESANSNIAAAMATSPPRLNTHDEGLFGENCACGSSASGIGQFLPALFAALALLALARRR